MKKISRLGGAAAPAVSLEALEADTTQLRALPQDTDADRAAWERVGKPRAISWEVWQARGYTTYSGVVRDDDGQIVEDDRAPVREAYRDLPQAWQRAFMTRKAGQQQYDKEGNPVNTTGGVLINRYAPPHLALPPVLAEMRPDNRIVIGMPWSESHSHWVTERPESWKRARYGAHTAWEMRKHIVRHPDHGGWTPAQISDEDIDLLPIAELQKMNVRGRHRHKTLPKQYCFPPSPKVDTICPDGTVQRLADKNVNYASRLDVHPWAVPMLRESEYVFFGIEGCLKADAILTAILVTGAPASVFSVPAVWLWFNAHELGPFVDRYLRDKIVVIVPDADWFHKPSVAEAALYCCQILRGLGVTARVAAPPVENLPEIKGVDDHLAAGHTLDDLIVMRRARPRGLGLRNGHGNRRDAMRRNMKIHLNVAMYADGHGRVRASYRALARRMGVPRSRVDDAAAELIACGAWSIEGSLEIVVNKYGVERFVHSPTITIHPDLRFGELEPLRLANWRASRRETDELADDEKLLRMDGFDMLEVMERKARQIYFNKFGVEWSDEDGNANSLTATDPDIRKMGLAESRAWAAAEFGELLQEDY
jgi:hypothetical protein